MAFPPNSLPCMVKLKCRLTYTPIHIRFAAGSCRRFRFPSARPLCSVMVSSDTAMTESPFAHKQVLPLVLWCRAPHQRALPLLHRSYWLMRQTRSLSLTSVSLFQRVIAGCRQSLLGGGLSRHYLCNPCAGAWTPTPLCPSSAFARFFLEANGLTSEVTRSAHRKCPSNATSTGTASRGCSHSITFRLPRSLDPQVAPTAEAQRLQGSQAVYSTHRSVGYLPRDVVSLRVRHEQLTRLDFHQLDCSLVGRSYFHCG
jgi:hypothetical protein